MFGAPVAVNHIAISMPNREAWLKQLAWLRHKGVTFHRRVNHGMTHSLYISDPNGYGVEVLYDCRAKCGATTSRAPSTSPRACRPKAPKPSSTTPTTPISRRRRRRNSRDQPLSRTAGEGGERSEPGEGAAHTALTPPPHRRAMSSSPAMRERGFNHRCATPRPHCWYSALGWWSALWSWWASSRSGSGQPPPRSQGIRAE